MIDKVKGHTKPIYIYPEDETNISDIRNYLMNNHNLYHVNNLSDSAIIRYALDLTNKQLKEDNKKVT